jgi:phosphate/sulfate permease
MSAPSSGRDVRLRQLGESTTICNIVLAWVMTLPAAMLIAGNLDLIFRAAI